jgi:hypothetical protein
MRIEPVAVWETAGRRRVLSDVEGLARWLLDGWPTDVARPQSFEIAAGACLEALVGEGSADAARDAFVALVEEADIRAELPNGPGADR